MIVSGAHLQLRMLSVKAASTVKGTKVKTNGQINRLNKCLDMRKCGWSSEGLTRKEEKTSDAMPFVSNFSKQNLKSKHKKSVYF